MCKQVFLVFLLFLFGACSKKESPAKPHHLPSILVTIPPYAFFAEKIAHGTIEIHTLVPPNTNLHVYEPSPKSVEQSIAARAWFRIDEPIEQQLLTALQQRNPKMQIINLQENLPLLKGDGAIELAPCVSHHHDRDLHTWLSPSLALKQTEVIAAVLIDLFPEHAALYRENWNDLRDELIALERDLSQQLTPFKGSALLVSHAAFGYFCKEFGLLQLSIECGGKDPRPRDVEAILNRADAYQLRCVFLQKGFNNKGAELIGKKLDLPQFQVDPYARDYFNNMRQIAGYISK